MRRMKSDNPLPHFILAFLIALVGYAIVYHWIEQRRTRKGPWIVRFSYGGAGIPSMVIDQPAIGITNVSITFATNYPSVANSTSTLIFRQPRAVPYDVPFGQCVFMDTTFLPGTVTFSNFFGHEIELLPRVLIMDHQEYPWCSNTNISLKPLR